MRKTTTASLILAFLLLLAVPTFGASPPARFSLDGSGRSGIAREVVRSDAGGVDLTVTLRGFDGRDVDTAAGPFAEIAIPETGWTNALGKARLPVARFFVEVPAGARVSVDLTDVDVRVLTLADLGLAARIVPVQEPVEKLPGAAARHPFRLDPAFYALRTFGPEARATVTDLGWARGARVAMIEFAPVRYLPAAGRLEFSARATLRVRFVGGDARETARLAARYAERGFDGFLSRFLVNRPAFAMPSPPPAPAGFLVIAGDRYADSPELASYLEWKRETGYEVSFLTTSQTGRDASAIQAFVQGAFNTWNPAPAYLLLVGDTADVGYFTGTAYDAPATDLYFSTLAGNDYLPDLWVGRLPVTSTDELATAIGKLLTFERATWTAGDDWTRHATFIASDDHFYLTEATHDFIIDSYLTGYAADRLYSHTDGAGGPQIAQAVDGGRSLVVYSGHGDVTFWVDPYFDTANVHALSAPVFPFVQSYACLTGAFDASESFGESWVRVAGGASVYWGSSVTSYWDQDDALERGLFQGFFAADGGPLTWVGGMTVYAKTRVLAAFGDNDDTRRYFEMYNVLGDPSLDVWTAPPVAIAATYDPQVRPATQAVQVSAPGAAVALAGLAMNGASYGAAYLDASGNAVVPLSKPIAEAGTMTLTVTGHDLRPFQGDIDVRLGSYSVDRLTAEGGAGEVTLAWSVTGEDQVRGYNLERAAAAAGPYQWINDHEIAAGKGQYSYRDAGRARSTTYWYKLEVVDASGASELFGPVEATTSDEAPANDKHGSRHSGGCGCGG